MLRVKDALLLLNFYMPQLSALISKVFFRLKLSFTLLLPIGLFLRALVKRKSSVTTTKKVLRHVAGM